jgi:hemoglobin
LPAWLDSRTAAPDEAGLTTEAAAREPPDLDSRAQIHDLVVDFYREVANDDILGPVFVEVAEVDWSVHIPRLIDFWSRVLLGQPGYNGFVLGAHQRVHAIEALTDDMFDRWLGLFAESVEGRWQGPMADRAKAHATRMAAILARRLNVRGSASVVRHAGEARRLRPGPSCPPDSGRG